MKKKIIALSTSSPGGMLSVIEGYQRDGVFDRWNVQFVPCHTNGSQFKKLWQFIKAFSYIFMLAATGRIALIHCHVAVGMSFWRKMIFALLGKVFGIPVILHLHGGWTKVFYNSLSTTGKRLVAWQLSIADVVLVLSESWRSYILEIAPKANTVVLPNYVEMPESVVQPKDNSKINLLFLGLVSNRKGVLDLISAFAAALKNAPQLVLNIGGDGEVDQAKAYAHELALESNINFLGWVGENKKNELLSCNDIFILPSYNEGLPVSVLEAMSWGIPVIATAVGGIPELIQNNINGFLMTPADISALQNLLELLGRDQAIRGRVGLAGKETIQKSYSREVILPRLELLYQQLTQRN
jgi:glycosyltransferase involved in cell wall biosynthesis